MKKLFLSVLMIAVLFGMVYSQSITVTNPHGGENWIIGQHYTVTWSSTGVTGTVGVKLFQNGASIGYIEQDVNNTGSYSWTINSIIGVGPITAGSNYQIQIKKSGITSGLSGMFTISNPPSQATITVTNPHGGEDWTIGHQYPVTWNSTGVTGTVGVKLFQNGASLGYVKQNVNNSGSFAWTIDNIIGVGPITAGSNYQIQIKKSGVASGLSGMFTISNPIRRVYPNISKVITNSNINKANIQIQSLPDFMLYAESLGYIDWEHKIVKYHVAVKNKGSKNASNIPVKLEIYKRGRPGHIIETITDTIPSLPRNMTVSWNRTYQLNDIGTYDFVFKVNPDAVVKEYLYNNNTSVRKTISREALPDLRVWLMTIKVSILGKERVWVGVQNIGQKTSGPTKLKFYIETKGTKYLNIPPIAPGKFYTAERKEWFHSLKDVWVKMTIDPDNNVREDKESNNFAQKKLVVWSNTIFDK